MGANPAAGTAWQPAILEGQQLQPAEHRSTRWARATPKQRSGSQAVAQRRMAVMLAPLLRREQLVADRVPYSAQVTGHLLRTTSGHYLQAFRLGGASFESVDDA